MAIAINDAYVTNAGANSSSALGAATVKADTLIVVAHKAAKTANAGTVYLRKASGNVMIPLEAEGRIGVQVVEGVGLVASGF